MPETADFLPFMPRAELAASSNRKAFIQFCRDTLTTFGADLDFDSYRWDLSATIGQRGRTSERSFVNFTSFGHRGKDERNLRVGQPLPEPLAEFAKAFVRYMAAQRHLRLHPTETLTAFRAVAVALDEKGLSPDIGQVDVHVLEHAIEVLRRYFGSEHVVNVASKLCEIAAFLRQKHLSDRIPLDWTHSIASPSHISGRVGAEADEWREKRLPSREAIDAIPVAFELATEPRDVILTSIIALLCCAPDRINEVFALPLHCEVEEQVDGKAMYGVRWAGSKGHHDYLKPIIPVMADTAKAAFARLRKHTGEARTIAQWYEENPGRLYLPRFCERLRGQDLTAAEIAEIVGMKDAHSSKAWTRGNGIEPHGSRRLQSGKVARIYAFEAVERAILSALPPGFPIMDERTGLRYSQALLVVRRYEFGWPKFLPWRCMISQVGYQQIKNGFGGDAGTSVFDRLGISTAENPIRLTSHQLRHYLNTLAMKANVSQVDIAAWSGRKDIRQNAAYDHETGEEFLQRQRRMDRQVAKVKAARDGTGALAAVPRNLPVSRSAIVARGEHGHMTELGFCRHDFASAPCPMFMECLHCTKHVCIKGDDPRQVEKVRGALEVARSSLEKAQEGDAAGYEGAEEWVRAHTESIERLEQLLALLTDPGIPDGTKSALARSGRYDLVGQALHDRGETDLIPSARSAYVGHLPAPAAHAEG